MNEDRKQLITKWIDAGDCVIAERDKKPLFRNYRETALTADTLDDFLDDPTIGYGLLTGENLIAFDCDQKNGQQGFLAFLLIAEKYGMTTDTLSHRTPSGGFHFFYTTSTPILSAGPHHLMFPGLEVKGVGGKVTIPPTANYSVSNDLPIAALPTEAEQWIISSRKRISTSTVERSARNVAVNKEEIVEQVLSSPAVASKSNTSCSLWSSKEKTRGGYFLFYNNPQWVYHPALPPAEVSKWFSDHWSIEIKVVTSAQHRANKITNMI